MHCYYLRRICFEIYCPLIGNAPPKYRKLSTIYQLPTTHSHRVMVVASYIERYHFLNSVYITFIFIYIYIYICIA